MLQVNFPVLLMKEQYVQLAVSQKLKPRSLGADPVTFGDAGPLPKGLDGAGSWDASKYSGI